jgi:hypothetical protein
VENAIIVDVEPTTALRQAEVLAAKRMIERTAKTFALRPSKLLGDSAYGSAEMLGWLVDELGIEPCSTNRRAMMAPSRVRTSTMIRPATFISALAAGR